MKTIFYCILSALLVSCSSENSFKELRIKIDEIISSKNATFGIGILDFKTQDTLFVNGNNNFVMMSVVKFPQAIALLDKIDKGEIDYSKELHFEESELREKTYSPYRDERKANDFELSLSDALSYTVSQSDNNVCDKLFKIMGGPNETEKYIKSLGYDGIKIGTTYSNMQANTIYANQSTPQDMAELLYRFKSGDLLSEKSTNILWNKLVETSTGPDRIKGLLPNGTTVGHKTGTSGTDENGITAAYNDVGIVELPNGNSFAIVVFISDSNEDDQTNALTMAEISKAAYNYFINY